MTIKEFTYFPYLLKLKTTFQTSSCQINGRKGFIVSINDDSGNIAHDDLNSIYDLLFYILICFSYDSDKQ